MHPLRVLLFVSLGFAAAVAFAFASLLNRSGAPTGASLAVAGVVMFVFLLPWAGVFLWALRRAGDIDLLIDRTRRVVGGRYEEQITDRTYHGEIDEVARAIEEMRAIVVRQNESFAQQRALIEQILESLGEALVAVNARGKIVFANARAAALFGFTDALAGRSVLEVARKASVHAVFDEVLKGRASSDRFSVGVDESERLIEVRAFPVADSAEVAAVAIFIDLTRIERLQRMRRDFLDDFSHEVRTPLTSLRSAVELFEGGPLPEGQQEQILAVMMRQLERLERLVRDLSHLNRIESGEIVLEKQPADLLRMMRELAAELEARVQGDVAVRVEGQPVVAAVDERIQHVFSNILDNAWKHGGRAGEIVVTVEAEPEWALVRISDSGEGIPANETERIFNRFYRVDKSRSQNVPGVGLGLAIAKHLVLLHGGTIRARNRPEGGALFEVRLPRPEVSATVVAHN